MEDRRIDPLQIIGMMLIFGIFMWMMYNQPVPDLDTTDPATTLSVEQQYQLQTTATDSPKQEILLDVSTIGVIADTINLQNNVLSIGISTKGGVMTQVALNELVNYQEEPLYLIDNDNSSLNIAFTTISGQLFQTKFMLFTPKVNNSSEGQELRLRAPLDADGYIELVYTLPNDGYRFGFEVVAEGIEGALDPSIPATFSWRMDGFRHAKSAQYENRYTQLAYNHKSDKFSTLSAAGDDDENLKNIGWVSYRQHFFSSILIPENPFEAATVTSSTITNEEEEDSEFLKAFSTETTLPYSRNRFQANFDWYMGPTDYEVLKTYDEFLYESISFGWGLIGWINRSVFYPLFSLLSGVVPQGIAIILLTIIVRLVLSPVLYKSYVSQAKMRVLRPEIMALNEKYKNDATKRQQETMKLYSKAGASPMAGCIPALIQMPVFFALFYFFPIAYEMRGKSFLWAKDLSSYDMIAELPFSIPFYGDHVSLFPLLASVAIFIYTQMTAGQQMQPSQPGMPNMKYIMYLMPVMMLFFFNNYASGFSLYYFVSNVLMIGIMLVIKNFIIDQDKIHAQIEENKKKPKKQNRFQRKMSELMEEAERQKKLK
ncbi:MAG: membrane protein insertase YidC [Flavobacteriaceae bacterium]|nr:membrane protein insertase YidC [Flavobacteriaceae bacterium]